VIESTVEIRIKKHFKNFLDTRMNSIENLSIWDMEINPFLIAVVKSQLRLKTPHDLAEWLVKQRIERGLVTAFGKTLQTVAKEFSSEKTLPGLTMKLKKAGKTYNMMIKSGPNPYPMQPAIDMQRILLDTRKKEPSSIPIFCMCYGNEEAVSNIVKTYMNEVKHLVGKDFWEFISGDKNCQQKILTIAKDIGNDYRDKKGNSLNEVIERKIKNIEEELKQLYGYNNSKFWSNVLEDTYV